MEAINRGLEGVLVAETRISHIDGATGSLILAGDPIAEVAASGLTAAMSVLWEAAGRDDVPDDLPAALGAARAVAWEALPAEVLGGRDGMAALRAGLDLIEADSPVEIMGALAVCAAGWLRARRGEAPLAPDPRLGHAEDLLAMAIGPVPQQQVRAEALSVYLACVCEHGLNASTFTARAVASTGASERAAVVAAIGALSGPLHGGAPGPVLDMLDAVENAAQAERWIASELAASRRIMGMGHRVYRVRDPRAAVLEAASQRLAEVGIGGERLMLAAAVERAAAAQLAQHRPGRRLHANVEFATAVLLEAIGFSREGFAVLFACGRAAGWLAHTAEERRDGRLIRPRARYIGR
ncbi:MAG: citrate synthase [Myxococcota bacterium]|jgi:citrate synthase